MNKLLVAALLAVSIVTSSRADEEDAAGPASGTPEAASAARDKGYRAEEADKPATPNPTEEEAHAPVERHADARPVAPPAQRPLGGSGKAVQSSSGGGGAAVAGVSCEKSEPPLKSVQRKEINLIKTFSGPVVLWEVAPNEAISYKFKTTASGTGAFNSEMGTNARPVATMQTVSETPCDFNVEKVKKYVKGGKGAELCYAWGPVSNGVVFTIGGGKGPAGGCALKPNTVYYYNIRSLSNPDQGAPRDACADEIPFFKSRPDLRVACGGIWKIFGSLPSK